MRSSSKSDHSADSSDVNVLTSRIIGAAIAVHRALGPGLLESTYEACLAAELRHRGLRIEQQVPVPLVYRGVRLETAYRIDLLVEGRVILELKALEKPAEIHAAQLLTYLRLSDRPVGLLINFNVRTLKEDGIKRFMWGQKVKKLESRK